MWRRKRKEEKRNNSWFHRILSHSSRNVCVLRVSVCAARRRCECLCRFTLDEKQYKLIPFHANCVSRVLLLLLCCAVERNPKTMNEFCFVIRKWSETLSLHIWLSSCHFQVDNLNCMVRDCADRNCCLLSLLPHPSGLHVRSELRNIPVVRLRVIRARQIHVKLETRQMNMKQVPSNGWWGKHNEEVEEKLTSSNFLLVEVLAVCRRNGKWHIVYRVDLLHMQ